MSDRREERHFQLLNEWLLRCIKPHDHHRKDPYPYSQAKEPQLPKRLLHVGYPGDKDALSMVSTKHFVQVQYIVVSHRWGDGDEQFQTTEGNIGRRTKRISFTELPKTFQDAVVVTRCLGFEWLWIDSLCIVQKDLNANSTEELRSEIGKMEDIFSNASCTIAATSAKSCKVGFLHRFAHQSVHLLDDLQIPPRSVYAVPTGNKFVEEVEKAELNNRGWVLQERALSRRTIHFCGTQTYWECGAGVACESDPKCQPRPDDDRLSRSLSSSYFPEIDSFSGKDDPKLVQDILARYSRLGLTHPEDKPFAIAGLEYRLATYCDTLTVYGVFAKFLHQTLLWQRAGDRLEPIPFVDRAMVVPPSWSCMAYTGGIDYIPVPHTVSSGKTNVTFEYPGPGPDARCVLSSSLWKVPAIAWLEQCEKVAPGSEDLDRDHSCWAKYDDGRDLNGAQPEYLKYIPLLMLPSKFTYGLLVDGDNGIYRRIGVASVQTRLDYPILSHVIVA